MTPDILRATAYSAPWWLLYPLCVLFHVGEPQTNVRGVILVTAGWFMVVVGGLGQPREAVG